MSRGKQKVTAPTAATARSKRDHLDYSEHTVATMKLELVDRLACRQRKETAVPIEIDGDGGERAIVGLDAGVQYGERRPNAQVLACVLDRVMSVDLMTTRAARPTGPVRPVSQIVPAGCEISVKPYSGSIAASWPVTTDDWEKRLNPVLKRCPNTSSTEPAATTCPFSSTTTRDASSATSSMACETTGSGTCRSSRERSIRGRISSFRSVSSEDYRAELIPGVYEQHWWPG